ncbi:MAG TPA: hypothetical protein VNT75_19465 [Symbiobacteriaceae bacterium]|nr:hypothetical protein [Symbiobacteriaceae bacterium]
MLRKATLAAVGMMLVLILGCSREDPLLSTMRQQLKNNAGMLVGITGETRSLSDRGEIWTEYSLEVKRSDRTDLPPGKALKVYRRGGSVTEGTGTDGKPVVRQMIVDDGIIMPGTPRSEVFVVLKAEGERRVILRRDRHA